MNREKKTAHNEYDHDSSISFENDTEVDLEYSLDYL